MPWFENFEDAGVQTDFQIILAPLSVAKPVVKKEDSMLSWFVEHVCHVEISMCWFCEVAIATASELGTA